MANHFIEIRRQLEYLAQNEQSTKGRHAVHLLWTATGTATFVMTLHIIAKYSSILEPITQALQAVQTEKMWTQFILRTWTH